jgi:hypothetical protein
MPKADFAGVIITVVERDYESFKDDRGNTVEAGKTYKLHLLEAEGRIPQVFKLRKDQVDAVRKAGFGHVVKATCWINARGNVIEYSVAEDGLSLPDAL